LTKDSSKPGGRLLELGTGAGMSTSWILSGMTPSSTLVTVDNDVELVHTAESILGDDARVTFVTADAANYLTGAQGETFDLIFADTWAGKFEQLDEALALLAPGGLYVVDDLDPQPQWPDGHAPKVPVFRERLNAVPWLAVTRLDWSTGLMIAARLS